MLSQNFRLNSNDKAQAVSALRSHFNNNKLSAEEFNDRKLLVAVADRLEDLETIFADLGGVPEATGSWRAALKKQGQQLEMLDISCIVIFLSIFGMLHFIIGAQWAWILLPAIVLVPMVPRFLVDFNREDEQLCFESGAQK